MRIRWTFAWLCCSTTRFVVHEVVLNVASRLHLANQARYAWYLLARNSHRCHQGARGYQDRLAPWCAKSGSITWPTSVVKSTRTASTRSRRWRFSLISRLRLDSFSSKKAAGAWSSIECWSSSRSFNYENKVHDTVSETWMPRVTSFWKFRFLREVEVRLWPKQRSGMTQRSK